MKIKISFLKKIIKEELQAILNEEKTQYNFKLLNKVKLAGNRLGRYKKCQTGGTNLIGLKMSCMGKEVAVMQSLINKWFEKNEPDAKKWKEETGKAIIVVDGLYGRRTAEALAYIYNVESEQSGPVLRKTYDTTVNAIITKDLSPQEIQQIQSEIAQIFNQTGNNRVAKQDSNDRGSVPGARGINKPGGGVEYVGPDRVPIFTSVQPDSKVPATF